MDYTNKITVALAKIVGSLMTIGFSLVAFAHGQNCTLLPWWNPSTLIDGQSRTGYQITEATYSQSCTGAAGQITCISWSVANGNIYKYPSCIPHTWANCTTPTGANHLEYRTLYKAATASYFQTCQQLSQSLQCLNWVFTWWITPSLFGYASCVDPNRAQCIDIWSNSYKDHGETVIWYVATNPTIGQTCSTLQKTLTCTNGIWSWGNQSSLVTWCTNPGAFSWCLNIRTNTTVPHGSSLNAYTQSVGVCANILQPLTCINWLRNGGNQTSLYGSCTEINTAPCVNVIAGTGYLLHGSFITKYTTPFAFEALNQSCSGLSVSLQCNNGNRVGGTAAYTGCQNVQSWACLDIRSNHYVPHLQFIYGYTANQPTTSFWCEGVKKSLICKNSSRYDTTWASISQSTLYSSCSSCVLPRWASLAEGSQVYAYSSTGTELPKSCNDFSTILSCSGGVINGNYQTYKYPSCIGESLVPGIDLAIDESAGLPGYENISGFLIAQWSSPEINILFKNKWDTAASLSNVGAGFLECTRDEQNLKVYASNILSAFVVNPWTKVGINIRIKSIFSQSLGQKTMTCSINPGVSNGYTDVAASNNTWSATFEIVEAERFDLALSKSIASINKNLEAAEWATGTQWLQNFLFNNIMNVLVPLIIILWILSAILWFYKIMFSPDDAAVKEWTRYIIFWVVGIIIIMSAKFIGQNVFDLLTPASGEIKWFEMASWLYDKILYPFIKLAMYLVLGAMFVILVSRVITFLFGSDSDAQKKAGTLIWWNVISMLIIIWAKQIVQAIYGKQDDVVKDITNLWEVWSGILADKNIPILYQIINYALGIASLVILVIIIIQTIKLLMKPDDPAQVKSIKNSLMYMFIGILILGAGYLIVNFAIIN